MPRFKSIIGLSALILLTAGLQACSAVKLAYNNAPDLSYWYLDGYVDFNGAQSLQVKEGLAELHNWHRQTQLPIYLDALRQIKQKIPADLDAAQACDVFADARRKLIAVTVHAEPAVATLATTLGTDQLTTMERKFEKGNSKYREDYVDASPSASRKKRYKEAVSRAEMLYGRLDQKQLERISFAIDQSSFNAKASYQERLRRQGDMLQTMRAVTTGASTRGLVGEKAQHAQQTQLAIAAMFSRSFNSPNLAYQTYLEQLTQSGCKSFAELHNSTTAAQRAKAVEIISDYEQDLSLLASNRNKS